MTHTITVQPSGRSFEAEPAETRPPFWQSLKEAVWGLLAPVIILGGMGLKYDDYLYFKDTLEKSGAMSRTIFFIPEPPLFLFFLKLFPIEH